MVKGDASRKCSLIFRKSISFVLNIIFNHKLLFKFREVNTLLYSLWVCGRKFKSIGKVRFVSNIQLRHVDHMIIGNRTSFESHSIVYVFPDVEGANKNAELIIGEHCVFGEYNHISCANRIEIGNDVLTGRWVTIVDNGHGRSVYEELRIPPTKRKIYSKGPVVIGDNVWIGDKVTILPNVHVGNGAIIAANSVVTKDVPSFCLVGGNPAQIIKKLNI